MQYQIQIHGDNDNIFTYTKKSQIDLSKSKFQ